MTFERVLVRIVALSLIALGTAYVALPELMLALTGTFTLDQNALIDVRATYGGIQLGLGAALLHQSLGGRSLDFPLALIVWAFAIVGCVRMTMALPGAGLHVWVGLTEMVLSGVIAFIRIRSHA